MLEMIEKIRIYMQGRNGLDRFVVFTALLYLFLNMMKTFFWFSKIIFFSMWALALIFLAITVFRFLSKNLEKRRREAEKFDRFLVRLHFFAIAVATSKKLKRLSVRFSQRKTHRFRTCPQCKTHLRLKKKRGIRRITCPECGRKFKRLILF